MIAQAGLLAFRMGQKTEVKDSTCTQRLLSRALRYGQSINRSFRYRTDQVHVAWRA
jgi:N6-L-threonylcarbamoyladenine synthase